MAGKTRPVQDTSVATCIHAIIGAVHHCGRSSRGQRQESPWGFPALVYSWPHVMLISNRHEGKRASPWQEQRRPALGNAKPLTSRRTISSR